MRPADIAGPVTSSSIPSSISASNQRRLRDWIVTAKTSARDANTLTDWRASLLEAALPATAGGESCRGARNHCHQATSPDDHGGGADARCPAQELADRQPALLVPQLPPPGPRPP